MVIKCYTEGFPLSLILSLQSAVPIQVKGFDERFASTVYFDQRITPEWIRGVEGKVDFPLPISPETLMVQITGNVQLLEISNEKLKSKALYLTPDDEEFMKCAEWLSTQIATLAPGTYSRGPVMIELSDVIIDSELGALSTPARVDHETGTVQIAQRYCSTYTVPMLMFILTHERMHYVMNTVEEEKADLNAMNICLSMGFPKMELLYAATKIFPDNPQTRKRLDAMVVFAKNWKF